MFAYAKVVRLHPCPQLDARCEEKHSNMPLRRTTWKCDSAGSNPAASTKLGNNKCK